MYQFLKLLEESKIVKDLDILNFVDEEEIQALYVKAILIDGSILYVRELVTPAEEKYSYHWQTKRGRLICRWDNAPHHPKIRTFPHHKHEKTPDNVLPSEEITLEKVLKEISKRIGKQKIKS